jgi:hypothetical protein
MAITYVKIFSSIQKVKYFIINIKYNMKIPDNPPTSIFFRFLASRMTTVSLPAVGTYLKEKQMSPSLFS